MLSRTALNRLWFQVIVMACDGMYGVGTLHSGPDLDGVGLGGRAQFYMQYAHHSSFFCRRLLLTLLDSSFLGSRVIWV